LEDEQINKILSKEYLLEHGTDFEYLADGGKYGLEIVEFDKNNNEIVFTGLAYALFDNGNVEMYMFVKDGIKQGTIVRFYPNGNVESVSNMVDNVPEGKRIEYYESGAIKTIEERIGGFLMTFVTYDENGNIIEEKKEPTDFDKMMAKKFG
jgi:antitoxin component YwqK of YwqJK toxin-antitoxin module